MRFIVAGLLTWCSIPVMAQYFQFSQYNYTPQRINPAMVASSDYAMLNADYRNQSTDGGFHLNSTILNVSYPLISAKRGRWSGVGLSFMDDRSGSAGIFNTQEAALSYAMNLNLAPYQSLSFGVKVLYSRSKLDLGGLYTGSQYIPDRGFDESISSGENLGQLNNNFMTFSTGAHWQRTDKKGINVAYWDISFFDFNKPDNAFTDRASSLNNTLVVAGGIRAYKKGNMSLYPEFLYTRSAANNILNAGVVFRCDLLPATTIEVPHVDFLAKYVVGRSAILGFQYHNDRFSIGFSYDFPIVFRNVANTNTVEIGLTLKKLVVRARRAKDDAADKKSNGIKTQVPAGRKLGASVGVKKPVTPKAGSDTTSAKAPSSLNIAERLKQKQDSVVAQARAGDVSHDPLILEKATLYFNFQFNSADLDNESTDYLDGLAKALIDNPALRIKLEGHTDNVGSQKFNMRLSFERAKALKEYLQLKGVEETRISVEGKGMTKPLNGNLSEDERAKNRRVELQILYAR